MGQTVPDKRFNIPMALTWARIAFIPLIVGVFYVPDVLMGPHVKNLLACVMFVVAAITDALDGYIARHYNQVSDFGKFLDPLADKLLVTACMMIFVGQGRMASWIVFIVIAREFAVTGLRLVAVGNGRVIAAGWSGKIKTSCTMVGLIM